MGECGAEVSTVDGAVSGGFGGVEVFAASAVEFDRLFVGHVEEADGEEGLLLAEDAGAAAKVGSLVFFELGWEDLDLDGSRGRELHTIFARPRAVTIHRACINP